jgi:hypothetical protein
MICIFFRVLASLNRRSEDVSVFPVIISELELGNIERHVFAAHLVERADHTALEDRPEAFDGLSMDCSDDIFTPGMVHSGMGEVFAKALVTGPLIGAEQADFVRDRFMNEGLQRGSLDVCDNASNDISLTTDSANDWSFAGTDATSSTAPTAFIPMPVLGETANESFIDFDNSAEFINVFHERDADAMTHIPSGFQRTKAHIAPNLTSAHALFAGQHQVDDAEPVTERFVCVFEDSSGDMREAIAFRSARVALPMPWLSGDRINLLSPATRAANAIRPTLADEVGTTRVFVGKHCLELGDSQLMDLWALLCSSHGDDLSCWKDRSMELQTGQVGEHRPTLNTALSGS